MELELRELLSSYEFPGDDIPIVKGSALQALEGGDEETGKNSIHGADGGGGQLMCRSRTETKDSRS